MYFINILLGSSNITAIAEVSSLPKYKSTIHRLRNMVLDVIAGFAHRGKYLMGQKVPANYVVCYFTWYNTFIGSSMRLSIWFCYLLMLAKPAVSVIHLAFNLFKKIVPIFITEGQIRKQTTFRLHCNNFFFCFSQKLEKVILTEFSRSVVLLSRTKLLNVLQKAGIDIVKEDLSQGLK